MSQTQEILNYNGKTITLVGTAHISEESVQEVKATILEKKPDCVAIELDEKRCESVKNPNSWRELDIVKVLKKKQGFLLLANLILASFQKKMGNNVGVKPGDEMIAAMNTAEEINVPVVMVDRPIQVTLRRAWALNNFSGKMKLLALLLGSAFSKEEVSHDEIEGLKNRSEMDTMMQGLSQYLPKVKQVLIDERDQYLASHIWQAQGNNVVAVLGAGHLPGVKAWLEKFANQNESTDTTEISQIPAPKPTAKIIGWIIPAIIIAMIGVGFYFGGKDAGSKMALSWVIWNSALAGIGALIAAAHPITILVSAVGSPITSLCPLIGVGFVAGIVQAMICKPKVKDMETLTEDASSVKGFYKNRILRVLLVFLFSSIGSSLGAVISGADIIAKISALF